MYIHLPALLLPSFEEMHAIRTALWILGSPPVWLFRCLFSIFFRPGSILVIRMHAELQQALFDQPPRGFGHLRVELAARFPLQFQQHFIARYRAAVGALRNHGIDRIRDVQNPGGKRDILSGKALGIPLSVIPLMMLVDGV